MGGWVVRRGWLGCVWVGGWRGAELLAQLLVAMPVLCWLVSRQLGPLFY